MKLFLSSSIADVGAEFPKYLDRPASEYKLLFIITAAEVEPKDINHSWIKKDKAGLVGADFQIEDYTITNKSQREIEKKLNSVDICFVNGGNTFYLLDQMRKTGFDKALKKFLKNGGIYGGSSAGSIVAGINIEPSKNLDDASLAQKLKSTKGLGLVNFVLLPHWGSENFKDLYLNNRLASAYKSKYPILLLGDDQYVVLKDNKLEIKKKYTI